MPKVKDWQKFAQKMADELGIKVTVGYETQQVNIAEASPKKRESKEPPHDP